MTYRANVLAGNTLPVDQLCDAIEARGANARPVHCYSLRAGPDGAPPAVLDLLRDADVVVTTTWAAGGAVRSGDARAAGRGEGWASPLDPLGVAVLQAVVATGPTDAWAARTAGLSPLDVTLGVAIPEFDGRIIGPAFAFKEVVDDGDELGVAVSAHRAVPGPRRAGRRARRPLGAPAANPAEPQAGRGGAVGVSDQAQPDRQRRRPRHARQPAGGPRRAARRRLRRRAGRR